MRICHRGLVDRALFSIQVPSIAPGLNNSPSLCACDLSYLGWAQVQMIFIRGDWDICFELKIMILKGAFTSER